ncbi:hypothetical protein Tco_0162243 [Tanacetum coccineum]
MSSWSSSATLSSMKNLDETDKFGDQFLNDKPTEDDQEKTNVVDETESIIPDPSHQTNTSAPPVTTPVINISSPKPSLQKTDHFAAILASIQSQVPIVVDKFNSEIQTMGYLLPNQARSKNQKRVLKRFARTKREQEEQKHVPTYTIKSTDTTTLKEFDLKAALFKTIHENKSANRNPANNRLYNALIEALIEDENAMEKEVANKVKDHKRKHDSTSGSTQPPSKDSKQSTKNKLDFDASAAQQPPAHTSSAWKITDIRDAPSGSLMPREQTGKCNHRHSQTYQDPEENKLQRKTGDIGSFIKWFYKRTGKKKLCKADLEGPTFDLVKSFHKNSVSLQFQMDECYKLLTDKVDLVNPEGHQILRNVYEPLPLGGPPSQLKVARYLDFGLEELVPSLWVESERDYEISAVYGITHWWVRRKEFYINKHREPLDHNAVDPNPSICEFSINKQIEISYDVAEKKYRKENLNLKILLHLDIQVKSLGPSARSNQGESTKRRRHDSSASGSAQPPFKDSEQSTKNKLDSNASAAQQPPARTSSAWQITDTRDTPPGPSIVSLQFQMDECHKLLTDKVDLVNPEGHQILRNVYEPLPLGGPPVRSHMRILSVISIKTYERYGYNYLREIVLRRADYKEYKISEKDFKNLHPNDFEDLLFKFNKGMETRKWTEDDKRRSEDLSRGDWENTKDQENLSKSGKLHPSETKVFHNEDGNPARANIKQALGSFKDGDGDGDTQFQ